MSTYQDMTEQEIWNELVTFSGSKYAAAAIMGNLSSESAMSSTNLQGSYEKKLGMSDEEYTAAVDSGNYDNFSGDHAGYGLAQWTATNRKENLLNYANANNSSIGSTKLQIAYLEKELAENYPAIFEDLKKAGSVDEATEIFLKRFESPSDQSYEAVNRRAAVADKYYEKYASSTTKGDSILLSAGNSGSLSSFVSSSSNSSDLSNDLSDVTIDIQVDSLNDICNSWNKTIGQVDLTSINVQQAFSALTSCNIAVSYIPSLANALSQVTSLVNSVNQIILTAGEEQVTIDDNAFQNSSSLASSSTGISYGGSSYSSGYYSGGNSIDSTPSTSVDNSNLDLQINTDMINTILELDFDSYIKFMQVLSSIVTENISLTTYLSNSAYADILKKTLLEANGTPDNLKVIIADMDPKVLQTTLRAWCNNGTEVVDVSKSVMYNYLENLSKNTNVSMSDMFKSKEYLVKIFSDFRNISNNIGEAVSDGDVNVNLTNIYDGNSIKNIDSNSVNTIRSFIDKIADNVKTSAESLLTNPSNSAYLKSAFQEIGKAYNYVSSIAYQDIDTASSMLSNIFLNH